MRVSRGDYMYVIYIVIIKQKKNMIFEGVGD